VVEETDAAQSRVDKCGGGKRSNCGNNSVDVKNRQISATLAVLISTQSNSEVSTAVLLKNEIWWDVLLYCWAGTLPTFREVLVFPS
jgi:hypothetical protein